MVFHGIMLIEPQFVDNNKQIGSKSNVIMLYSGGVDYNKDMIYQIVVFF